MDLLSSNDHIWWLQNPSIPKLTGPVESLPFAGLPSDDDAHTIARAHGLFDDVSDESSCKRFIAANLFTDNNFRRAPALVIYPGSGGSWLRTILMALTGIYIDSVDPETVNLASGAVNVTVHHDCGCTLMKMTHDISTVGLLQNRTKTNFSSDKLYDGVNLFNGDGVLLIRNPFEAIITYYNYSRTAMSARHYDEDWDTWVTSAIVSWETLATTWIGNVKRGGVVYYENLVHDTESELRRFLKLLSFPSVDEERLKCVLHHTNEMSGERLPTYTRDSYSMVHTLLILESIEKVQLALKARNLDALPVKQYQLYSTLKNFGRYKEERKSN